MGDEGGFPLVAFLDSNIVISPAYIKLGKDFGVFKFVNEVGNQGEGVCVSDSVAIEILVVLARSEASILFFDKEERRGLGGFGRTNFPRAKVFINELVRGLLFLG